MKITKENMIDFKSLNIGDIFEYVGNGSVYVKTDNTLAFNFSTKRTVRNIIDGYKCIPYPNTELVLK